MAERKGQNQKYKENRREDGKYTKVERQEVQMHKAPHSHKERPTKGSEPHQRERQRGRERGRGGEREVGGRGKE